MLIYDLLREDHLQVFAIIDAIEKVTDTDRKRDLFSFLRTQLILHSKAEEEALYRPLRHRTQEILLLETSFDHHHQIEHMLMEIQNTSPTTEGWMHKIRMLKEILKEHIDQEENILFQVAQNQFSSAEAEDMGFRFMEEKGKLGMENPITMISRKIKEIME